MLIVIGVENAGSNPAVVAIWEIIMNEYIERFGIVLGILGILIGIITCITTHYPQGMFGMILAAVLISVSFILIGPSIHDQ